MNFTQTKIKVAVNDEIRFKADLQTDKKAASSLTCNYEVLDLTIPEIAEQIRARHNIAPVCFDKAGRFHRSKADFKQTQIVGIDFDNPILERYITFEQALEHPFIKQYAAILYETASSTPTHNRFRPLFVLPYPVTNQAEIDEIIRAFMWKHSDAMDCDESCKDRSRFFYGAGENGRVEILNIEPMSEEALRQLVEEYREAMEAVKPNEPETFEPVQFESFSEDGEARRRQYAERVIQTTTQMISDSRAPRHDSGGKIPGNRHDARLRAGRLLGGYIAGGMLTSGEVETALSFVIASNTDNYTSAMKTFRDALHYGMQTPITFEQKERERQEYLKKQQIKFENASSDALASLRNLTKESKPSEFDSALRLFATQLLSCDALGKELARDGAIKILKECKVSSPARLVDSVMPKEAESESEEDSKSLNLKMPELWAEPVDGAELLNDMVQTLGRFLSALDGLLEAVALWILYAHAFEAFDISPILAITSPEKRCGKSTLLMMIDALVPKPLSISNISAAALFRTIEKFQPTILIDEADTFLTNDEQLRGVINSGHTKKTAFVIRTVGEDHDPQKFTTWAPKVIAMIGALPGTVEDRSIVIKMQRKQASEEKEKLRFDRMGRFEDLRRRAARWAADNIDELRSTDANVPKEISNDRARDNWRVLLSVADCVGGDWAKQAREVACNLAGAEPSSESPRTLLLQDLKALFEEKGEQVTSEDIIVSLAEMENRPWAEWRSGKAISKVGLAKLLRPFGIQPTKWKEDGKSFRGYTLTQFQDTFARYIDPTPNTPPLQSPLSPPDLDSTVYSQNYSPPDTIAGATASNGKPLKTNGVASGASATGEYQESNAGTWGEL